MSSQVVTEIVLITPVIDKQTVYFNWIVSPETELYKKTGFYLTFPDSVPLDDVPMRLWWTVFLICIHSHWALLSPCDIYLPVRLAPGEAETWTRLLMTYINTLDALATDRELSRDIRIIEQGEMVENVVPLINKEVCATAFSGGKDSLAQAGLLMEMGFEPRLVATTSPMEGEYLHRSKFRAKAMQEMKNRFGLNLVEVHSDLRENWDNLKPRQWGYKLSLNELADTLLYTATLVITGYVCGATRLFLASENEVSRNCLSDGVFLQLTHFMYSALTQASISALLEPFGMRYGSLNSALHSNQIQELVVQRYANLSDLQCSCWLSDDTVKACSICAECKRLAWVSLAAGGSPARMGVDLIKMLKAYADFVPDPKKLRPHIPNRLVGESFKNQMAYAILGLSPETVQSYISCHHPDSLLDGTAEQAMQALHKIQAETLAEFPEPPSKSLYRAGFVNFLDRTIKEKLLCIFDDQFEAEDVCVYSEELENLLKEIDWVTQPLARRSDNAV